MNTDNLSHQIQAALASHRALPATVEHRLSLEARSQALVNAFASRIPGESPDIVACYARAQGLYLVAQAVSPAWVSVMEACGIEISSLEEAPATCRTSTKETRSTLGGAA